MTTILLTGGAGYIGSHCVKRLMENGYEVVVLDNLSRGFRDAVLTPHFFEGNIGDREILEKIFTDYKIDAVMHFSAFACVGESVEKPAEYYENNVAQTLILLTACKDFGVKNFIFSSTCATYGDVKKIPINETTPIGPLNPYGHSKRMVELILQDFDTAYGLKHCIFRYFNAAGCDPEGKLSERHDPETHLIPIILQVAKGQRENIKIFGTDYPTPDGTCIRDYIHVNDLSDAHILGLKNLLNGGESDIFNLGSENGFSVREVIDVCREVSDSEIPEVEVERRPGDAPKLVADSTKAKTVLGWTPESSDLRYIVETAWNSIK
ncbi:MAG: UDP-glucose 4-epimerase GalE [Chlamydiae bacterium]|nr:MAG: UDP-glucose 4-epimerase GalE [Chlamydiota bacterium]